MESLYFCEERGKSGEVAHVGLSCEAYKGRADDFMAQSLKVGQEN